MPPPVPRVMVVADVGLVSWGIETGGGWSHMANLLADGSIIDARSDRVHDSRTGKPVLIDGKRIPPGVQRRPGYYLEGIKKWVVLEAPSTAPGNYDAWKHALEAQLGKPYDFIGILDFLTESPLDRNWRDQTAWFCDELAVFAMEQSGYCPPLPQPVFRITPSAALLLAIGLGWRVTGSRG